MYRFRLKRLLDFSLTATGLIFISPLMLAIVLILAFTNSGKVFFYQHRPGKDGKVFQLVKFKTMNDKRDSAGKLLSDAERLTRLGLLLRSLSLDELPQLFNVLKGDMSLVGPRPLLVKYLPRYSRRQARRHEVRPGITGWAQINGRNAIRWEEKFEYDVYYVENLSFGLDVKILWLTILKVFRRDGINNAPRKPMDEFLGS